jgi:hypothetical protein
MMLPTSFGDHRIDLRIRRADFERPDANTGMSGHQFDGVLHALGFKDQDSADLLFGFGVGPIGRMDAAATETKRLCQGCIHERFAARKVAIISQKIVVCHALLHHALQFLLPHGLELRLIRIPKANESHVVSPIPVNEMNDIQ